MIEINFLRSIQRIFWENITYFVAKNMRTKCWYVVRTRVGLQLNAYSVGSYIILYKSFGVFWVKFICGTCVEWNSETTCCITCFIHFRHFLSTLNQKKYIYTCAFLKHEKFIYTNGDIFLPNNVWLLLSIIANAMSNFSLRSQPNTRF